jgi:hypothetical protein
MADADRHGRRPRGKNHPLAKFTDADIVSIRADRESGMTYEALALKYSTSGGWLHSIVHGSGWSHIKETARDA